MECFAICNNGLNGILSPLFFISKPKNTEGFILLKNIAKINPKRKKPNLSLESKVPYVGLPETDNQEIQNILLRPYKDVKGRNIIKKSDILFARIEPSIFNKKYIFVNSLQNYGYAFTSTEFYIVEPNEHVDPEFLFYMFFTTPVYRQVIGKTTGSTGRRRLDKGVFEDLLIPFPSRVIQNKIVQIMQSAYEQKKQKEQEARTLLDSINDYVLHELGVRLPKMEDKKYYRISSEEIGKRYDPYYYQPKYLEVRRALEKGNYKLISLKDTFLNKLVKGILPKDEEKKGDVNVLQIRNIQTNGLIDIETCLTAKKVFNNKHKLNIGDVLIVITGATIGKVGLWVFGKNNFFLGGDIVKFTTNKEFNPVYIQSFLLSVFGQLQIKRHITGATNKHLAPEDVALLKIPYAPFDVQNKIAQEVKGRMSKAEKLRIEAKEQLEEAKQKVEKMILEKGNK